MPKGVGVQLPPRAPNCTVAHQKRLCSRKEQKNFVGNDKKGWTPFEESTLFYSYQSVMARFNSVTYMRLTRRHRFNEALMAAIEKTISLPNQVQTLLLRIRHFSLLEKA